MIQIKENIIGIEVPEDAKDVKLGNHCLGFKSDSSELPTDTNGFRIIKLGMNQGLKFEILGTVDAETIDFDCSGLVEHEYFNELVSPDKFEDVKKYWDYEMKSFWLSDSDDSFRSLLTSLGIYWVNPYGKEEPKFIYVCCLIGVPDRNGYEVCCGRPKPNKESTEFKILWEEAESRRIKGKLVILKKN